jgi:predicted O-methyltransferase YrrM
LINELNTSDKLKQSGQQRSKLALLAALLQRSPKEFWDRIFTFADFQSDRIRRRCSQTAISIEELRTQIANILGSQLEQFFGEPPLAEIEDQVSKAQATIASNAAFGMFHGADFSLARLCYAICRMKKPAVILETGVAHGVSSAFLLQAMAVNGMGELWSVDLPPLAEMADSQAGILVPEDLRTRWHLVRGTSRRVLPGLVAQLPRLDMFLHDSLHTYRNMKLEFATVWPKLAHGGVLISDDVEMNRAFQDFAAEHENAFSAITKEQQKDSMLGVIIKSPQAH